MPNFQGELRPEGEGMFFNPLCLESEILKSAFLVALILPGPARLKIDVYFLYNQIKPEKSMAFFAMSDHLASLVDPEMRYPLETFLRNSSKGFTQKTILDSLKEYNLLTPEELDYFQSLV